MNGYYVFGGGGMGDNGEEAAIARRHLVCS